jgi:hypothetical protein
VGAEKSGSTRALACTDERPARRVNRARARDIRSRPNPTAGVRCEARRTAPEAGALPDPITSRFVPISICRIFFRILRGIITRDGLWVWKKWGEHAPSCTDERPARRVNRARACDVRSRPSPTASVRREARRTAPEAGALPDPITSGFVPISICRIFLRTSRGIMDRAVGCTPAD